MNDNSTVNVGDVLIQTSSNIYDELQSLLLSLRSLTPELRYTKLRTYFNICKKKLIQLLSIIKWLTIPSNIEYFNNLNQLRDQLYQIEQLLNEAEYTLYCSHSHLFSRRVRSLNVIAAKDILATKTYSYIPIEVFTCGIQPIVTYTNDEKDAMNKRLGICIRAKLALYDTIPNEIKHSNIIDGLLILKQPYLYEIGITLSYANEKSSWKVIGFRILSDIHHNENVKIPKNLYDKETYESEVLKIICKSKTNSNNNNDNNNSNNNNSTDNSKMDDSMIIDNDNDNNNNDSMTLNDIHKICMHASLAVSLRLLYLLANIHAKTIRKDLLVDFSENAHASALKISFWKSLTTGNLLYELRINHCRIQSLSLSPSSPSSPRQIGGTVQGNRFFVELWSRYQNNNKLELKQIHGIQDYVNAEDFVSTGSSLSLLLSNVLGIIAESKLQILLARLLITPEVIAAKELGLQLALEKDKPGLVISFGSSSLIQSLPSSSEMIIGIDNQYGQFKIRYSKGISTHINIDRFLSEINNIESEEFNIKVLEDIGINGTLAIHQKNGGNITDNNAFKKHLLKPFLTADVVLFQLAVNHWACLLKQVSELEPAAFNHAALLESNSVKLSGECLVFELLSGRNVSTLSNDVMSNAMNMIPETYMLPNDFTKKRNINNDEASSSSSSLQLLKKLKPNELIFSGPDHFLYLVLVIDKSYSATLTALLCARNSNPLYLPKIKSSLVLNTLQFHNDNNNNDLQKAISNAYEWESRSRNDDIVRPYTVALHVFPNTREQNLYFMSYFSNTSVTILVVSLDCAQIRSIFLLLQKPEQKKDGLVSMSSSMFEEYLKKADILLEAMISLRQSSLLLLLPVVESVTTYLNNSYDALCHQHLFSFISLIQSNANDVFTSIMDTLHKARVLLEFYGLILKLLSNNEISNKSIVNLIHYNNICDADEISMVFAVMPNNTSNTNNNTTNNKEISNFIKAEAKFPDMTVSIDNNGNVNNVEVNDFTIAITNILNN